VYTWCGTLNISLSFLSVEFIRGLLEGEISGEAQTLLARLLGGIRVGGDT
jgi:hypothetical protein